MGLDIVEIFKIFLYFPVVKHLMGVFKKKNDSYSRVKVHVLQSLVFVNIMPLIISLT